MKKQIINFQVNTSRLWSKGGNMADGISLHRGAPVSQCWFPPGKTSHWCRSQTRGLMHDFISGNSERNVASLSWETVLCCRRTLTLPDSSSLDKSMWQWGSLKSMWTDKMGNVVHMSPYSAFDFISNPFLSLPQVRKNLYEILTCPPCGDFTRQCMRMWNHVLALCSYQKYLHHYEGSEKCHPPHRHRLAPCRPELQPSSSAGPPWMCSHRSPPQWSG